MITSEETLVQIMQGRTQSFDADYLPSIKAALQMAYGIVAEQHPWSWMRASESLPIDIVANTSVYEIESQEIQYIYDIQNSAGVSIIQYRTYDDFVRQRNSATDAPVLPWTDLIALALNLPRDDGTRAIFTDRGRNGQNLVIEIFPTPDVSFTAQLVYTEKGSDKNYEKMTPTCGMAVIEGALSLIGPPKEVKQNQWVATTRDSWMLFQNAIDRLRSDEPKVFNYTPGFMLDPVIAAQLDRI